MTQREIADAARRYRDAVQEQFGTHTASGELIDASLRLDAVLAALSIPEQAEALEQVGWYTPTTGLVGCLDDGKYDDDDLPVYVRRAGAVEGSEGRAVIEAARAALPSLPCQPRGQTKCGFAADPEYRYGVWTCPGCYLRAALAAYDAVQGETT